MFPLIIHFLDFYSQALNRVVTIGPFCLFWFLMGEGVGKFIPGQTQEFLENWLKQCEINPPIPKFEITSQFRNTVC